MESRGQTWLGVMLVGAGALAFSSAGLFALLIKLDVWTMLFWRGIFAGIFIGGYVVWQHGAGAAGAIRAIGKAGLLAAACTALASICFISALRQTTVADVMVINATAPFLTAALAWLWTAEREHWTTLAASLVALVGVVLTVNGTLTAGQLLGDLLALIMTILLAAMMVIVRRHREVSMLPAACLSAFLCSLIALPLSQPGAASATEIFYLMLFGTTQFGLGLLLLTVGTRLISATRSALVGSVEFPLAPAWVWLAFGEAPPAMACLGGLIILGAVLGDLLTPKRDA